MGFGADILKRLRHALITHICDGVFERSRWDTSDELDKPALPEVSSSCPPPLPVIWTIPAGRPLGLGKCGKWQTEISTPHNLEPCFQERTLPCLRPLGVVFHTVVRFGSCCEKGHPEKQHLRL